MKRHSSEIIETEWLFSPLASSKFAGGGSTLTNVDGKLYAFGGCNREGMATNDIFCYNPDIGAWSEALQLQTPTKPCQRFGHSAVSFGSLLYIYGGQSFKAVEQHENHQQGQQMLHEGTTEHGQPLVDEPMISITIHDDVYCFDTETLMWVEVDTETLDVGGNQVDRSLLKRHSHIALPLPSGNMLVFGGASEYNKVLNDIWELNLKTKSWVQINALSDAGSFPPAREMHSACYHNIVGSRSSCCKIYIMGGRSADGTVLGDFWLLALQDGDDKWLWHRLESAPTNRCAHSAAVLKHRLCHFGGWDGHSATFNDILIYNTDVNTWVTQNVMLSKTCQKQTLPEGRFGHSGCSLNHSFLIVMGGVNATSDLNDLFAIMPNFKVVS